MHSIQQVAGYRGAFRYDGKSLAGMRTSPRQSQRLTVQFGAADQQKSKLSLKQLGLVVLAALGIGACAPAPVAPGSMVNMDAFFPSASVYLGTVTTGQYGLVRKDELACHPVSGEAVHRWASLDSYDTQRILPIGQNEHFGDGIKVSEDGREIIFPNGDRIDCETGRTIKAER